MEKISILITGGNGDIASAIKKELEKKINCEIYSPTKDELNLLKDDHIKKWGDKRFDVLINCAGYIKPMKVSDPEYIKEVGLHNKINIQGPQELTSLVLQKNKKAIIINIGSTAGSKSRADWSAYCTSKAAMIMFTKCMFDEGIKAICISPGRTNTKMRNNLFPDEDKKMLLNPENISEKVILALEEKLEWDRI